MFSRYGNEFVSDSQMQTNDDSEAFYLVINDITTNYIVGKKYTKTGATYPLADDEKLYIKKYGYNVQIFS